MNKLSLSIFGIILVVIVAAGAYVVLRQERSGTDVGYIQDEQPNNPTDNIKKANVNEVPKKPEAEPGRYEKYSESALADANGTTLLFFHAPWCPQCRELDASISTSSLPNNTSILKVDYDTNQALRQQYGVTIQTTVVKIDESGDKIDSYVAYDQPTFESVRAELLP